MPVDDPHSKTDPDPNFDGRNEIWRASALDALAEMSASRSSAVELALLDPPYNTAALFHHYADREASDVWLRQREAELLALRPLLSATGSVWMHIDDREMHYAKVMMDGVFGRDNFVSTIVWQKTLGRENRTDISSVHEYLLVYARDRATWRRRRNLLPHGPEQAARYKNPDNDPRGLWASGDLTAKAGPGRRAAQFYDVITPAGTVVRPAPGMAWRFTRERFDELRRDSRIVFGPTGGNMPRLKRFLTETQGGLVPNTWWDGRAVGTSDSAKKHLRRLFPDMVPFETPKPEELARRVMLIATDPGDLVLDLYGGSGTTAATAHKMRRQWIVVEREPATISAFLRPRLQAVVAGADPHGITALEGWTGGGRFYEVEAAAELAA